MLEIGIVFKRLQDAAICGVTPRLWRCPVFKLVIETAAPLRMAIELSSK